MLSFTLFFFFWGGGVMLSFTFLCYWSLCASIKVLVKNILFIETYYEQLICSLQWPQDASRMLLRLWRKN